MYFNCLVVCNEFGSLDSVLKESHISASAVHKSSHKQSGRSPFYSRLQQRTSWHDGDITLRSRNEFIALEFVKKVRLEMVSVSIILKKIVIITKYSSRGSDDCVN